MGNALDKGPAAAQESQLGARDSQHGAPDRQLGGQDGELGGQDGPTWRSEAVPNAVRNVPESAVSAQTTQDRNFVDILSFFYRFFHEYCSLRMAFG